MIRVRSLRSASTPPNSAKIQNGALVAKASRPSRKDDPPKLSTSQGSATDCIQVPMFESKLPHQKASNVLLRRGLAENQSSGINMAETRIMTRFRLLALAITAG